MIKIEMHREGSGSDLLGAKLSYRKCFSQTSPNYLDLRDSTHPNICQHCSIERIIANNPPQHGAASMPPRHPHRSTMYPKHYRTDSFDFGAYTRPMDRQFCSLSFRSVRLECCHDQPLPGARAPKHGSGQGSTPPATDSHSSPESLRCKSHSTF